jgi:CRISP-associated protein Cas1
MSTKYNTPSELKTILHSKRAYIYYLEHCSIVVKGGRVEYVTEKSKLSHYWNIPIANTTCLLLGSGTSVTQAAMRELAKAGVLVGFCGGDGVPLFAANERQVELEWILPQSEYRPTSYLQDWVQLFFNKEKRLAAAKFLQESRLKQIRYFWLKGKIAQSLDGKIDIQVLETVLDNAEQHFISARDQTEILTGEARFAKNLYRIMAEATGYGKFTRAPRATGVDFANRFLDQGNYLAYGLAATAAWVLGLPHGLAVLHGKTRRGGLVFDIADIIKDALILPNAFIAAMEGEDSTEFRRRCTETFQTAEALDRMIDTIKSTCSKIVGGEA